MRELKINILSPGRFHVCDLARELDKNGFDVRFYSFVPARRAEKFGLPKRCSRSVIAVMAPFLFIQKCLIKRRSKFDAIVTKVQDYVTGIYMRKCDVCIAMSGSFVYSVKKAKRQGAAVILERGSKHILEQRRILESIPSLRGTKPVPDVNVKRELEGYEIADYIAIATQHVKESFLKYHYPEEKLFVNPYGVDLSIFKPLSGVPKEYDVIMVGGWSYRKGCDLIIEVIKQTGLSFLHVGSIVDIGFPQEENFTHVDAVDQLKLIEYYHQAKIFILPSREEGLAMVQAQAIACNLPLVGSPDSGAVDLKNMVEYPEYITIIENYTIDAVIKGILEALANYKKLGSRRYAGNAIENLTWEAYGKRYAEFLNKITS